MFSKVLSFFSHVLEPFRWGRNETLKRKRFPNDENDMLDGATAHKKLRPCNILTDSNITARDEKTQADLFLISDVNKPVKPYMATYDLTKEPDSPQKENWRSQKKSEQTPAMSPKNKFKAPAHCRSPGRGLKSRPLFTQDDDDEPQFVQTIVVSPKTKKSVVPSTKKSKVGECSGVSKRSGVQFNTPRSLSKNSRAYNNFMKNNTVMQEHDLTCKEQYKRLLGTLFRNPDKYPHFQVSPAVLPSGSGTVDLTSDDSDDDVILVQPFQLPPNVSVRQKTPTPKKMAYVDLTKTTRRKKSSSGAAAVASTSSHPTIDLSSEDNDVQVAPVRIPKINSLEEALKQIPITQDNWISEMTRKYKEEKAKGLLKREKLEKECKTLFDSTEHKLDDLLTKEIEKHLAITESVIIEDEGLPELTPEMNAKINHAMNMKLDPDAVLAEKFGYTIRRRDLMTLAGTNWLNDEVINFYMSLLMERGGTAKKYPSIYAFNTFFYPKVVSSGHAGVKRWTRKVDIFSNDFIIVPIHLQLHWCMACIDLNKEKINYYDSMGSPNTKCLNTLLQYLEDEMKDKKKEVLDTRGWTLSNVQSIPQQMNGSDCGIFACTFAEFLSRRATFTFSQEDMQYFRRKMVWEILQGELMM